MVETLMNLQNLRTSYRPAQVNMLFVGESPPASGRFFYRADSGLYRATRSAFVRAFPSLESLEFLDSFRQLGCYLIDLCDGPVDQLPKGERRNICVGSESSLARQIVELQPRTMVTTVRSIGANVRRALGTACWTGEYVELPYPGRWRKHQLLFEERLVPLLRRELHPQV